MKHVLVMVPCRDYQRHMLEYAADGQCTFQYIDSSLSGESLSEVIASANIIIGQPDISDLYAAPALEWIQMCWAGTDKYTNAVGFPKHITLTNASGAFGSVIAEHVFAGILSLYRRLPSYHVQQKKRIWGDCGTEKTIEGSRVLIIGTGDIGSNLAQRFRAFGAHIVGIRRNTSKPAAGFHEIVSPDHLEQQLPLADIVIGCVPGTSETAQLLQKNRLLMLKPDAVLVNVGRGSLIATDDLAEIMIQGHLFGAVLDVTDPEPLPSDHPLWGLDNVILTPHVSGVSFGHSLRTENKIFEICCDNLRRYINGQPLRNEIIWDRT